MSAQDDVVIDWFRVITDLNRAGVTDAMISEAVGRSRTTVVGWRCGSTNDIKYHDGERLIALWRMHMVPSVPMKPRGAP